MFYTLKKIIASIVALVISVMGNIDFAGVIIKNENIPPTITADIICKSFG